MNLNQWLSDERGRNQRIAAELAVSGSLITQWAAGKPVSAERCVPIEEATGRAVRRWDLRPDDWHRIWPELIGREGAPAIEAKPAQVAA